MITLLLGIVCLVGACFGCFLKSPLMRLLIVPTLMIAALFCVFLGAFQLEMFNLNPLK